MTDDKLETLKVIQLVKHIQDEIDALDISDCKQLKILVTKKEKLLSLLTP